MASIRIRRDFLMPAELPDRQRHGHSNNCRSHIAFWVSHRGRVKKILKTMYMECGLRTEYMLDLLMKGKKDDRVRNRSGKKKHTKTHSKNMYIHGR